MRGRGSTVRVWRGFSALGGLAVLALAAGCSGEPTPVATTPAPVVSSTPTPTPTPLVSPEPPAAMSEPTTDGAIAAATYFLALSDYAFSSGDTAPLLALSAGDCSYCAYVDEQVTAMVEGNYSSEADPLSVVTSRSTEIRPDEWFSAELRVEQGFTRVLDSAGEAVDETGASVVDFIFAMTWLGDGWRVEQVDLLEVPG